MKQIIGLLRGIIYSSIAWALLLGIFQGGRAYQAHLIKAEILQCKIGNICKVHTLNITLPLIMIPVK
jgi:hypothetical protein